MSEFSGKFKCKIFGISSLDPDIPGQDGSDWPPIKCYFPVDINGQTFRKYKRLSNGIEIDGKTYDLDYIRSHLINDEE